MYDPYVELYHYESKTRGAEDTKEKVRRFQGEIEYMRSHWIGILKMEIQRIIRIFLKNGLFLKVN